MITVEGRIWDSSLIKATEYIPDYQELLVKFAAGSSYIYSEITQSEYDEFCKADSQGSFFNKNFKGKKPFTKVENTETTDDGDQENI